VSHIYLLKYLNIVSNHYSDDASKYCIAFADLFIIILVIEYVFKQQLGDI